MDQDQVALSRLVRLPLEFAERGDVSITDLAKEAIPDDLVVKRCISRDAIREHIESNNSLVELWLDWSADKRCGDGTYFVERGERFIVGHLGGAPDEEIYDDSVTACASFVWIELNSWLGNSSCSTSLRSSASICRFTSMSKEAIQAAIPHRDPFLLIDEVVEQTDEKIVCRRAFSGDEFWYRGHYPDYPLTPGVLLCEACLQAGAVLLSKITEAAQDGKGNAGGVPVATRLNNVQFREMVRPGDAIRIDVDLVEVVSNAYFMKGRVTNETSGKLAARCEFACTVAAPQG